MSNLSKLDPGQILQRLFNEESGGLQVVDASNGAPSGPFDHVSMVESMGGAVETYTFKNGGSGGTVVKTVVVTYTSASKETLSSVDITVV